VNAKLWVQALIKAIGDVRKSIHAVIIAPVPDLNKSLARSNKNPFYQGFLTGIVTINLREFFIYENIHTYTVFF